MFRSPKPSARAGARLPTKLSMRVLARTWQMLLKGLEEVAAAGRPLAAAEMVLVRIAYAADLPTPDEVIRSLGDGARGNGAGAASGSQASPRADMPARTEARSEMPRGGPRAALAAAPVEMAAPEPLARGEETATPVRALASFEELVALAAEKRDIGIKSALERDVRLVRFEDGRLEFGLEPSAPKSLTGELSKKLADWTGRRWMVIVSAEQGQPSLYAQAQMRKAELKDGVRADPLVQAVLTRFPGAEIVDVRAAADVSGGAPDELPFVSEDSGDPADEENGLNIERLRRRCSAKRCTAIRDRACSDFEDLGSAAHHIVMRCARESSVSAERQGADVPLIGNTMADFFGLMKQAAELKSKMEAMQAELDRIEVEGTAGGGLLTLTLSGKGEVRGAHIDESLLKPDQKDIVQDLIVAAHADARRKLEVLLQERMQALTGGLPLPPGLKLF